VQQGSSPSPATPPPSALNREAASLPSASAAPASSAPTEIVVRPDGLRHGKWEAPHGFFSFAGTLAYVGVVAYFAFRALRGASARNRRIVSYGAAVAIAPLVVFWSIALYLALR